MDYSHCTTTFDGAHSKISYQKKISTVVLLVSIHLISNLDVFWVIENSKRTYIKRQKKG